MRLVVKQGGRTVNELRFTKGPIYIGRHANSQVFLSDAAVSRQHAVIFTTQDNKWVVEDLDSANKTYLNEEAVHKSEIKTGDVLRISDFILEVNLEDDGGADKPIHLEDTLTLLRGPQIVARELDSEEAPPIRLPAKRSRDFLQATETICKAGGLDELLLDLLSIALKQFDAYHVWCALRDQPAGPMTCHGGKHRDGSALQLSEIKLNDKITEAVEKNQFLLFIFSRVPGQAEQLQVRSVLIAPIMGQAGCFGVLYVDNAMGDEHYNIGDLDYLMLLGIHTAAILESR
jgi:hypothetical protein